MDIVRTLVSLSVRTLDDAGRYLQCGSFNHGQACIAGTRIYVQSGIYDKFLAKLTERANNIKLGDPFHADTVQGPQVSKAQFDVCLFRLNIVSLLIE